MGGGGGEPKVRGCLGVGALCVCVGGWVGVVGGWGVKACKFE